MYYNVTRKLFMCAKNVNIVCFLLADESGFLFVLGACCLTDKTQS